MGGGFKGIQHNSKINEMKNNFKKFNGVNVHISK